MKKPLLSLAASLFAWALVMPPIEKVTAAELKVIAGGSMTGTPRTHATIVVASAFMAKLPSVGYQHLGDEFRFAHGLAGEGRALFEPGARRRRAPQGLAARIAQ